MTEMTTGKRLAAARKAAGFRSQEALGDRLGVSSRTVRYWESDAHPVPVEHRETIVRLLGNVFAEGDAVEVAIANSELTDWRQDAVRSVYRKNLAEQREGRAG